MMLGKLRRRIAEIRKKHPHMDISFTIPSGLYHLPDDYFAISVFDCNTRLIMKRLVSMSDFDIYDVDFEEALIMILDNVVEGVERSK